MSQTIRVSTLLERLKNAEDESERFYDSLKQGDLNRRGVHYLYEHVLTPLLEYRSVSTGDLDMAQFDREDIMDIFDYYNDNLTSNSEEFSKLRRIYSMCKETKPQQTSVTFL